MRKITIPLTILSLFMPMISYGANSLTVIPTTASSGQESVISLESGEDSMRFLFDNTGTNIAEGEDCGSGYMSANTTYGWTTSTFPDPLPEDLTASTYTLAVVWCGVGYPAVLSACNTDLNSCADEVDAYDITEMASTTIEIQGVASPTSTPTSTSLYSSVCTVSGDITICDNPIIYQLGFILSIMTVLGFAFITFKFLT